MTQGKRVALSAAQRTELWSRWKEGQSLHVIGRAFGKPHNSIHGFYRSTVGLFRQSVGAHCLYSLRLSERTFLEGSLPVCRFAILPKVWSAPRRR
jgi:hypothetical protein